MVVSRKNRPLSFLHLFEKFIKDSRKGKRLQPNGKKISKGTICNYFNTLRLVKCFCIKKGFYLRIRPIPLLSDKEVSEEKDYWNKFYKKFSDHLYDDCGYYDNYVGLIFKNIKAFFNYLIKNLGMVVGNFHKSFYAHKEEIAIFPLMPEELNFLICNKEFEETLKPRMKEVKDFFVFGCTVALRFSDLNALKKTNVRHINGSNYLAVRSIKTGTDTLMKLPDYAFDIILKYSRLKNRLLPKFNIANINKFIKRLLESAGFTQAVLISRNRRGNAVEFKKGMNNRKGNRFCDMACSHTMRRTAITTMLSLGVPEQIVRQISGHSPNGKEFYRYVFWSQAYQDRETEKMYEILSQKRMSFAEPS